MLKLPLMVELVRLLHVQSIAFLVAWTLAFLVGHRFKRTHWLFSIACLALLEWVAAWLAARFGAGTPSTAGWIAMGVIVVIMVAATPDWNAFGQACLSTTLALSLLFLTYMIHLVAVSHLGPVSLVFSSLLVVLQAFSLVLLAASCYEILDVQCRARMRRVWHPAATPDFTPRVSLHVPAYNEPPEMVKSTLDALARLDYPNYEVIVIDDNTTDETLWRPIEAHCQELGFRFYHLDNWPGFKSGALNFALRETDPAAEIVGVVDSDYIVEPTWLSECVGFFRDTSVAFVQSPQDYRDVLPDDRYARACYNAYLYFFKVSMVSRNEHNGIIFAGTMGLVRRRVLEDVGAWDEWCITEDAELSLRILSRGYQGVYVDRSFGRGLMPLNFEGLKKQRFRWAFGGMQILRMHWHALAPWSRRRPGGVGLSATQKWDYLVGGLQWLNDPLTLSFTFLLLLGAVSLLVAHSLFIQPLTGAVLLVPFLFVFMGVSRFLWALRLRIGCTLRQAAEAFTILLGLTWTVTLACVLGLVKEQGVFLRTPKRRTASDAWHFLRVVSHETILAGVCLLAAALLAVTMRGAGYHWLMVGLLVWQAVIYSSALRASLWSRASEALVIHPEYFASSRTTGNRFSSMVTDRPVVQWILRSGIAVVILFFLAVRFAPEEERIFRSNPAGAPLLASNLISPSPEAQVKAIVYMEGRAALHGDIEGAVRLWSPDGVIRDARYTAADTTDDHVWVGLDAIRERYREEFAQRKYLKLSHSNASVVIEGDHAVVVNDLRAEIEIGNGIQTVHLSHADRWVLKRENGKWQIVALELNRSSR